MICRVFLLVLILIGLGVVPASSSIAEEVDAAALQSKAVSFFGAVPDEAVNAENPLTPAKIDLGRKLYYEKRISKDGDISCNSCHDLASYGVDGTPTSTGHQKQMGGRNAPTVYYAAFHIAQFWDGRAKDVEEQAKGPILNPIEMAMDSPEAVVAVLKGIPEYGPMFQAAFPGEKDPITYDNLGLAIGAFERKLVTPSRFDKFIAGDSSALTREELAGFKLFLDTGCASCHNGPLLGGSTYQKLGMVRPYKTKDTGRMEVTGNESDRYFFKVPSLRNIKKTKPYFHDGSIKGLKKAIMVMASHQLGKDLTKEEAKSIVTFLKTLTGTIDQEYIAER